MMKAPRTKDAVRNLIGEVQSARLQLAKLKSQLISAREQSRPADREKSQMYIQRYIQHFPLPAK